MTDNVPFSFKYPGILCTDPPHLAQPAPSSPLVGSPSFLELVEPCEPPESSRSMNEKASAEWPNGESSGNGKPPSSSLSSGGRFVGGVGPKSSTKENLYVPRTTNDERVEKYCQLVKTSRWNKPLVIVRQKTGYFL
jgi:hypothetical protein